MAWCRSGDKPLSEPMMVSLPTHIYIYIYIYASLSLNELRAQDGPDVYSFPITLKFGKHLSSTAAEAFAKFQGDMNM